jgi:Eukaryotic initiation factor 4E
MSDSSKMPHTWILWYHDPNDSNYALESYTNITSVSTPAQFWSVVDMIPKEAWESGMFFFMRDGYRPLWDSPENAKGGAWSKKVDAKDTYDVFIDCMVHCMTNLFLTNFKEAMVGVSVSPKGQFHIIKMWNTTTNVSDRRLFNSSLKMKLSDDIVYKAHNTRPK